MKRIFYLLFITFCEVFPQKTSVSPEENIRTSLNLLVRGKRLIDNSRSGDTPVTLEDVPYIVNIQSNGRINCAGAIISSKVILTACHCVYRWYVSYTVSSGSSHKDRGKQHTITEKLLFRNCNQPHFINDLALLKITPPIDFELSPNRKIELLYGGIPADTLGTFSGWGCTTIKGRTAIMEFPDHLRSIKVQVISQSECQNLYYPNHQISNRTICTMDVAREKGSCYGDSGGPLVIEGYLAGILSWTIGFVRKPDVYVDLQRHQYRNWIALNAYRMDSQ